MTVSRSRLVLAMAFLMLAGAVGSSSAVAQQNSAPTPRPSPKQIQTIPTPRPSPKLGQEGPDDEGSSAQSEGSKVDETPAKPAAEVDAKPAAEGARPGGANTAQAKEPASKPDQAVETKAPTQPDQGAGREPIDPNRKRDWRAEGAAALQARLARRPVETRARNVILMIGDGMGVATATAIRLHVNQLAGGLGDEAPLPHEMFPYSALAQTHTLNAQTGDGAATATALMSGVKARSGVLGLDGSAVRGRCGTGEVVDRIGDHFKRAGRAVGYVTTARITHATPAAGYAASVERLWEHDARMPGDCLQRDIAQQLAERIVNREIDVAMGGGRSAFFSAEVQDVSGATGARLDGRNLIEEAAAKGARIVRSGKELAGLDPSASGGPILGLFAAGSMAYEHDRVAGKKDQPSLATMAETAIAALETASSGRGYFLMIEAGRIGQASHYGAAHHVVTDGAAFAEAVQRVVAQTDPEDTLVLVTADVAHTLSFNGYCGRGSPVPGLCYEIAEEGSAHGTKPATDASGAHYETTGFLNGPGAASKAPLTEDSAKDPLRRQRALIPMETQTTSAADVPVFARGPWAHLLSGSIDQTFVFYIMRFAAFGDPPTPEANQ